MIKVGHPYKLSSDVKSFIWRVEDLTEREVKVEEVDRYITREFGDPEPLVVRYEISFTGSRKDRPKYFTIEERPKGTIVAQTCFMHRDLRSLFRFHDVILLSTHDLLLKIRATNSLYHLLGMTESAAALVRDVEDNESHN